MTEQFSRAYWENASPTSRLSADISSMARCSRLVRQDVLARGEQSGFGRDRSVHAIDKYCDYKMIWQQFS